MAEQDPERIADEMDRKADELQRHSGEVQQRVQDARQDWERKRLDEGIPGAPPPLSEDDSPIGADEDPPPEARREG